MGVKRGFVKISIEEYDNLKNNSRTLEQLVNSDNCLEVTHHYSYDTGCDIYIANPIPEVKEAVKKLQQESQKNMQKYIDWLNRDKSKKIKFWHIGKTVKQVID